MVMLPGLHASLTLAVLSLALATVLSPATAQPLHMQQSTPAAESIIHGDHAQYVIRFDGPVNHFASRLQIMQGNHVIEALRPLADSAVDVLFASGPVPPAGRYALHWEAVAADGEITTGDIRFTVQP
jgi:methionine-rich copper-binding protein CopC